MRSVQLTPYLREILKTLRKKNNVRGDVLSKQINKGAAYISQIESGKVKEIRIELLTDIFKKITNISDQNFPNFIINLIDYIITAHNLETLESEDWIQIYDYEYRMYSIPDSLRAYISHTMQQYNLTPQQLIHRMNNQRIRGYLKAPINTVLYPINFDFTNPHSTPGFYYVRFKLSPDYIDDILYRHQKINYAFMAGILYYIHIDYTFENICLKKCHSILYDTGFFTVCERYDKYFKEKTFEDFILNDLSNSSSQKEFTVESPNPKCFSSLSDQDNFQCSTFINQIEDHLKSLYRKDPSYALAVLNSTCTNMINDITLTSALMASPINAISSTLKTSFWNDYQQLLNQYILKSQSKI